MGNRFRFQWLTGLLMVALLAVGVGYAYNLGVARGVAESGKLLASPGADVPLALSARPWGLGFGFFPIFPLFFILFWFVVLRGLFWRGAWYGRGCGFQNAPPAFDEWHRQAHARGEPPAPTEAKA